MFVLIGGSRSQLGLLEQARALGHEVCVVDGAETAPQLGVTEVRSAEELPAALERALGASRTGAAVLERFLEGDELTVNGFLLDGEYFPMSVTQRHLHPPPPLGVCIAHRYPSGLPPERERELFALAHAASRAVGIETGPSYVQLRVDSDETGVIEVGARLGGGKDAELAKLVTGFGAIRAETLRALGGLTAAGLEPGEPVGP